MPRGLDAAARRPLEAMTRTWWLVALFFLPILFLMKDLYLWATYHTTEQTLGAFQQGLIDKEQQICINLKHTMLSPVSMVCLRLMQICCSLSMSPCWKAPSVCFRRVVRRPEVQIFHEEQDGQEEKRDQPPGTGHRFQGPAQDQPPLAAGQVLDEKEGERAADEVEGRHGAHEVGTQQMGAAFRGTDEHERDQGKDGCNDQGAKTPGRDKVRRRQHGRQGTRPVVVRFVVMFVLQCHRFRLPSLRACAEPGPRVRLLVLYLLLRFPAAVGHVVALSGTGSPSARDTTSPKSWHDSRERMARIMAGAAEIHALSSPVPHRHTQ